MHGYATLAEANDEGSRTDQEDSPVELRDYVRILHKSWVLIVASMLLGIGVAALYSIVVTPKPGVRLRRDELACTQVRIRNALEQLATRGDLASELLSQALPHKRFDRLLYLLGLRRQQSGRYEEREGVLTCAIRAVEET